MPQVIDGLKSVGLTSFMTGMDNVRNLSSSPLSGIDPHELLDVRPICRDIDAMITHDGQGNRELTNLPRKINIALSPSRDDFPHTHINDIGLKVSRRRLDRGPLHCFSCAPQDRQSLAPWHTAVSALLHHDVPPRHLTHRHACRLLCTQPLVRWASTLRWAATSL